MTFALRFLLRAWKPGSFFWKNRWKPPLKGIFFWKKLVWVCWRYIYIYIFFFWWDDKVSGSFFLFFGLNIIQLLYVDVETERMKENWTYQCVLIEFLVPKWTRVFFHGIWWKNMDRWTGPKGICKKNKPNPTGFQEEKGLAWILSALAVRLTRFLLGVILVATPRGKSQESWSQKNETGNAWCHLLVGDAKKWYRQNRVWWRNI